MTTTRTVFSNEFYCVKAILHHPSYDTNQYDIDVRPIHTELKLLELDPGGGENEIKSRSIRNKVKKNQGWVETIFKLEESSYMQCNDADFLRQFDKKSDELITEAERLTSQHQARLEKFEEVVAQITARHQERQLSSQQKSAA